MSHENLQPWDKLLPVQLYNNDQYVGQPEQYFPMLFQTIVQSSGIGTPQDEFKLTLSDRFTIEQMASSPVMLRLLQILIRLSRAKRVIEIGSFIGLSALTMAKALPNDGELVTIEKFEEFAAICRKNFTANGYDSKIKLKVGDAFEMIDSLPPDKLFDFAFIDGNKERYADYFEKLQPFLAPNALVVVDDALFHGDCLNAKQQTEKGRGARQMLDVARGRDDYLRLLLPVSNGMLLMIKSDTPTKSK